MIKRLTRCFCLLATALFAFSSCSNDTEETPTTSNDKVQITFTIAMEGSSSGTRTQWAEDPTGKNNYQSGSEYENRIEAGKLQVLIYNSGNNFFGKVDNLSFIRNSENNYEYTIVGDMPVDKSKFTDNKLTLTDYKLVVFANYDTEVAPEANSTLSALKDYAFTYSADNFKVNDPTQCIPMWGVHKVTLNLVLGERADAGIIHVLRALAKIKVSLADNEDMKDYTLSEVELVGSNTMGYIVPTGTIEGAKSFTDVDDTPNLDDEGSLHVYDSASPGNLSFIETTTNKYEVYVPEYQTKWSDENNMTGGTNPSITLKLKKGEAAAKQYTIYLADYDENGDVTTTKRNIVRNTIYNYTITKVKEEANVKLVLKYQVMNWATSNNEVEFW